VLVPFGSQRRIKVVPRGVIFFRIDGDELALAFDCGAGKELHDNWFHTSSEG
jgi:hypothetical protein